MHESELAMISSSQKLRRDLRLVEFARYRADVVSRRAMPRLWPSRSATMAHQIFVDGTKALSSSAASGVSYSLQLTQIGPSLEPAMMLDRIQFAVF